MARYPDPAKPGRRLLILAMAQAGLSAGQIAEYFRYTIRHVRRELAEARRAEGLLERGRRAL